MTKQSKKQMENQSQTKYMQSNEPQIAGGETGKQNRTKTRSQDGRSMVEMLGVLAIIAVLSIGGIVGYKLAMNYYQADQIANEINLMRNDLKVKYALGNEELLLGDPYDETPEDEHYSGHLSTQYDRYPVDYDCIRKDKAEFYNCRETDAYYIKVGNVSKGVCKPLTTLVSAMDGRLEMDINGTPYIEDDLCSSDEANEFYIQFDAEEVNGNYDSNRPEGWCAKDDDCPDEKPFCENERCVECTPETGCESNTQHCENNECISCPGGKIWSGTACVDCMTDADCADPDTPICKTDEHICVECMADEDCLAKGTDEPICNTDTNTCEPCPEGESWKESAQGCAAYECRTNEDCNPAGGFENYCYMEHGVANSTSEWQDDNPNGENYSGECHKVSDDLLKKEPTVIQNIKFYGSNKSMNWWSSCRFCAARAKTSDEGCVGDADGPSFMLGYTDIDWQCHTSTPGSNGPYFTCTGTDEESGQSNLSPTIKQFHDMFSATGGEWLWLKTTSHIGVDITYGHIYTFAYKYSKKTWDRALCRD